MKTSCIERVPKDTYVVLKKSFLSICDSCFEAAILLAYFESWHNFKINAIEQNRQLNDVAEKHGDKRTQDETLFQHHTSEKIYEDCMGMVSQKGILKGRKKLVELGYISEHKNPNPKYSFDNTVFYLFHADAINIAIIKLKNNELQFSQTAEVHTGKMEQRSVQNGDTVQAKWKDDTGEMPSLLTNVPSNIPSNIPSNQTVGEEFFEQQEYTPPPMPNSILGELSAYWIEVNPIYKKIATPKVDNPAIRQIAERITGQKMFHLHPELTMKKWKAFCQVVLTNDFYSQKPLKTICNNIQTFLPDIERAENGQYVPKDSFKNISASIQLPPQKVVMDKRQGHYINNGATIRL